MSRRLLALCIAGSAVVILAGLGIGYGGGRWWRTDVSLSTQEDALPDTALLAQGSAERVRDAEPDPKPTGKDGRKRALLVGVTKYDHLPKDKHLSGPANDVRAMRRLLEGSYKFPAGGIVTLTEDEGKPDRRPTRANIEREFHRLADQAREGDQVVILLAGHGYRQPADLDNREPDGIDEIFLPADVAKWRGFSEKVPNALVDKEMGKLLQDITTKKAYVWIIFDCCHSGTMTRGIEVVRELPPGLLVPEEELDKARQRAAQRERTRGGPEAKAAAFVPREPSDYLVAVYACREYEKTLEIPQPEESAKAEYHGLLTYTLVDILTKSAASKAPLTYRELVQRLQMRYAARWQGSPATPLVEGKGQIQVVLGTETPERPRLLLSRGDDGYKVNAGDLYGLTTGSVLAVYSPAGEKDKEPKLLGHVLVGDVQPFEATVEPCAYEKSPLVKEFDADSTCKPVSLEYGRRRFKVAVRLPASQAATRQKLLKALEPLSGAKEGLVKIVDDNPDWLVRLEKGKVQLIEASGNQAFALPDPDSPNLGEALRRKLEKVYRARNLIAIAEQFKDQPYRGDAAVDVAVEVLRHKSKSKLDTGEVWSRPDGGWLFRPGDLISFRLKNNSLLNVDVTLLIVGSDFQIQPFYPNLRKGEVAKSLKPGETIDTPWPWGEISKEPPFGPERLVVIAVPAMKPPADFSVLAQDGLERARSADGSNTLKSPLGQLLESAMFRSGTRRGLTRTFAEQHGMRVLSWRTEPK